MGLVARAANEVSLWVLQASWGCLRLCNRSLLAVCEWMGGDKPRPHATLDGIKPSRRTGATLSSVTPLRIIFFPHPLHVIIFVFRNCFRFTILVVTFRHPCTVTHAPSPMHRPSPSIVAHPSTPPVVNNDRQQPMSHLRRCVVICLLRRPSATSPLPPLP